MDIKFGEARKDWCAPRNRLRWTKLQYAEGWECSDGAYWYARTEEEPTEEEKRMIEQLIALRWEGYQLNGKETA